MTKQQNKILAVIFKNAENGLTLDEISRETKISREWVSLEIAGLIEINAIKEFPGSVFKPSGGKLKMMR